jgi:hypothetical protein
MGDAEQIRHGAPSPQLDTGGTINITTWGVRSCPREAMGRAAEVVAPSSSIRTDGGCPVAQVNDLSRSLTELDPISTLPPDGS